MISKYLLKLNYKKISELTFHIQALSRHSSIKSFFHAAVWKKF